MFGGRRARRAGPLLTSGTAARSSAAWNPLGRLDHLGDEGWGAGQGRPSIPGGRSGARLPLGKHGYSWSFSPDGSELVVGGFGASLRVIDAKTLRPRRTLKAGGGGLVVALSWASPRRPIALIGGCPGARTAQDRRAGSGRRADGAREALAGRGADRRPGAAARRRWTRFQRRQVGGVQTFAHRAYVLALPGRRSGTTTVDLTSGRVLRRTETPWVQLLVPDIGSMADPDG